MAETIQTKQCSKCKQILPISEFHIRKASLDRHSCRCKKCCQEYKKRYYASEYGHEKCKVDQKRYYNSEHGYKIHKVTQKRYSTSERGREVQNKSSEIYRQKHPNEQKVRTMIGNAVRDGKLPRAFKYHCKICGNQARDYHHPDYSKPLEVIPLCRKCHKIVHNNHGAVLKKLILS